MAEQQTTPVSDTHGGCGSRDHRPDGFSFGLFATGLLALLVSVWALIGPGNWAFAAMIPVGWIIMVTAIVVGLVLVISPRIRRR